MMGRSGLSARRLATTTAFYASPMMMIRWSFIGRSSSTTTATTTTAAFFVNRNNNGVRSGGGCVSCRRRRTSFGVGVAPLFSSASPPTPLEPLPPSKLRWKCNPSLFDFETTADVTVTADEGNDRTNAPPTPTMFGQDRAGSAIEFGVGMNRDGYNIFVLGPPGAGKSTAVRKFLETHAKKNNDNGSSTSSHQLFDWCYVNNFDDAQTPIALRLPAGLGKQFSDDVEKLVQDLKTVIPTVLGSEEHRRKVGEAEKDVMAEHESNLAKISSEAEKKGLQMVRTPNGVALLVPNANEGGGNGSDGSGDGSGDKDRDVSSIDKKKTAERASEELSPRIREVLQQMPELMKRAKEKADELNKEAVREAVDNLILPLAEKYAEHVDVIKHLDAMAKDVVENSYDFQSADDESSLQSLLSRPRKSLDRYVVNPIVDNSNTEGAPVVYEEHPHYHNLIGRVEHESHLGSLMTSFVHVKAGALHRANGGYLVLRARDVLQQPFAWEALKRTLRSGKISIDSLGAELSLISTVSLKPDPIPVNVKIVLLGDRLLYYLLQQYDPDFDELFKVAADFNDDVDRSDETCQLYAKLLATIGRTEETRSMDREAVALMLEQASRQAGDQEKLSTHMRGTVDLLRESDYWAGVEDAEVIGASHVRKAVEQQIYRSDRIRELVQEAIARGTLRVDVQGEKVGQVNGLSVVSLGSYAFGRPSRITATARLGRGKVVDIEREVDLGGSIHSKGVMILSSFLASRYAKDCPLSLSASLAFEQSYGLVEGDSASMAELCALLSVLAGLPIKQKLAITGSIDQHGEAQAIGGVNEKIEGFYDVCNSTGSLTGSQGVLIPTSNAKHLMLRSDVVDAVSRGEFAIFTYSNVDEALSLLTGVPAGERGDDGEYPQNTVNQLVNHRLSELLNLLLSFSDNSDKDSTSENGASNH